MLSHPLHDPHAEEVRDELNTRDNKIGNGNVSQCKEVMFADPVVNGQLYKIWPGNRRSSNDDHKYERDEHLLVVWPDELQKSTRHFGVVALVIKFFRLGNVTGRYDFGCHKSFLFIALSGGRSP